MRIRGDFLNKIADMYEERGIDFNHVLEIWKNESLLPKEIKSQIKFDVQYKTSSVEAALIYDIITEPTEEKIARVLNTNARDRYTKTSAATDFEKEAGIDIEWVVDQKIGDNGETLHYLVRRTKKKKDFSKTASSHILAIAESSPSGTIIRPKTNSCPGMNNGTAQTDDSGRPCCSIGDSNCQNFMGGNLDPSGDGRDIECKIDTNEPTVE